MRILEPQRGSYSFESKKRRRWLAPLLILILVVVLIVAGWQVVNRRTPATPEKTAQQLQFDDNFTEAEIQKVRQTIESQNKAYSGNISVQMKTGIEVKNTSLVLSAYLPVANLYDSRQTITKEELQKVDVYVPADTDSKIRSALATELGLESSSFVDLPTNFENLSQPAVAFIPAEQLSPKYKLLSLNNSYYLDSFNKGAVFRSVDFSGDTGTMNDLILNDLPSKETTLKINMTGVTALTRLMMKKLNSVQDPTFFSEKIGDFLADADITHVSNEVSFREGCQYSNTSFCSPTQFIETLKDSGVDLVELTGNHNNDQGSIYNTNSINTYHELGWHTYGGGLDDTEAAKPYVTEQKGSKVTFLAYNLADGLGSGAIATADHAGANYYTDAKAKADIETAKQNSQLVIVDIQYSECQAYPAGFVEYPICDQPIGGQEEIFRQLVDFGADIVIGSSAHQPQTYEMYNGKMIYYGLGNLYFEQIQWPGTERGIILTHYVVDGKLIQTKLTPTVYGESYQTRLMDSPDAEAFLDRLKTARQAL